MVRRGRHGRQGVARYDEVWRGEAWSGKAVLVRLSRVRHGETRRGNVRQANEVSTATSRLR